MLGQCALIMFLYLDLLLREVACLFVRKSIPEHEPRRAKIYLIRRDEKLDPHKEKIRSG